MPRGVKGSVNYDAKLAQMEEKIAKAEKKLEEAKQERDKVLAEKKNSELEKLKTYIDSSGKSLEEVLNLIQNS